MAVDRRSGQRGLTERGGSHRRRNYVPLRQVGAEVGLYDGDDGHVSGLAV